ncbi:hypothetical protein ADK52_30990 [Streptomyces sp. WM6372]|uniref:hypothetical protein n=1 Tax=Streptomyces sp. WM6372 TaxID=1415555 RepID=UPI0006AE50C4|nr:hypothetical protein [Streptomyces sp. WM6372]KOU18110.1 hypothetical protein ADK52_30990 [Streptomyces sp. WM6372]
MTWLFADFAFTKKVHDSEVHRGDTVFSYLPGRYPDTDTVCVTSNDSRSFLTDGHSGTIPANTVHERAFEDTDVVVAVLVVMVDGVLITLAGIGCALAGYLIHRRAERRRLVPVAI